MRVWIQDHINAGQQFDDLKGLDDIVLCPQLQALYPVFDRRFRRQEDDRNLHWTDVLHQLKAVNLREHHIQQNQVIVMIHQQVRRDRAVKSAGTVVAFLSQAETDQVGDGLFVLYN